MTGEVLGLDKVSLTGSGPTLSMSLHSGLLVAVMGPAGSGKSKFLQVLAGAAKPASGSVISAMKAFLPESLPLRGTVASVLGSQKDSDSRERAAMLLSRFRLWDLRKAELRTLGESALAATTLMAALSSRPTLLLLDGHLDLFDPWTLHGALEQLREDVRRGALIVVSTVRTDWIAHVDQCIVLDRQSVRFAGSLDDLMRSAPPQTLEVETHDVQGVKALCEPFDVKVEEFQNGVRLSTCEGRALAAKLLLEGYGNVRWIVHRMPTLDEAIRFQVPGGS